MRGSEGERGEHGAADRGDPHSPTMTQGPGAAKRFRLPNPRHPPRIRRWRELRTDGTQAYVDYSMMEPALGMLAAYGPDLRNGLTNHAPMAVEALAALGRADAVLPWLHAYPPGPLPRPAPRPPSCAARARPPPPAPAFSASPLPGVIRVGHASRSLGEAETPLRRRELADALAYWAAAYQVLPSATTSAERRRAQDAIE